MTNVNAKANVDINAGKDKAAADKAAAEAEKTKEPKGTPITIASTNGRPRRRAGQSFGPDGKTIMVESLSENQRQQIQDDPWLKVTQPDAG